jgi:hypothetical protein
MPPLALSIELIVTGPVNVAAALVSAVLALIILAVSAPVTVKEVKLPPGMLVLPVKKPFASVTKNRLLPLICLSINGNWPPTELALVCEITMTEAVVFGYGILLWFLYYYDLSINIFFFI